MGILLTFMFLWNMVGAMVLLPALARYLLKEKREALDKAVHLDAAEPFRPIASRQELSN
jgi:hypothetical protein